MSQVAPAHDADVGTQTPRAHSSHQTTPAGPPQDPIAWHREDGSHLTVLAHT